MQRLRSDCVRCLLKNVYDVPPQAPEKEKLSYMQAAMKLLAEAQPTTSAPELVWQLNRLKKERFGVENEYAALKQHFNALMLDCAGVLRESIRQSEDPLAAAVRCSLVGNYIDFGAMKQVDESELSRLLATAGEIRLDPQQLAHLRRELAAAKRLVFLTDNCGEIVGDRLLIEVLRQQYPELDIRVLVRGEPVLNDATMEDARQVGLTELVPVLGNGSGVAGTCISMLSPEAAEVFDRADVYIAKGQGNFETLRGCGRNVFYLFLCKCEMFARQFGVEKLTGILTHDSCCTEDPLA